MQSEKAPVQFRHALVAQLYQQYASALLLFLRRRIPGREDAEDVLLEVFQAAVESNVLFNLDASKHHAWLWTVAQRKVTDYYRRKQSRPAFAADLEEIEESLLEDEAFTPEVSALRQETYTELRAHVASLPELQQNILRLRFAHGLTCSEIAQRLNKSHAAIRVMLSRSLNLLRDSYQQRGEDH